MMRRDMKCSNGSIPLNWYSVSSLLIESPRLQSLGHGVIKVTPSRIYPSNVYSKVKTSGNTLNSSELWNGNMLIVTNSDSMIIWYFICESYKWCKMFITSNWSSILQMKLWSRGTERKCHKSVGEVSHQLDHHERWGIWKRFICIILLNYKLRSCLHRSAERKILMLWRGGFFFVIT